MKNYEDAAEALTKAELIHSQNPIQKVVAFSEYDLSKAAYIRESLSIPGPGISETDLFTDKTKMKEALQSVLRTPTFARVSSKEEAKAFIRQQGLPVVIKPSVGAASERVEIITCMQDIEDLIICPGDQIEEFIDGQIYHVDGIRDHSTFAYLKISRYYNTCLMFRNGSPLGSITEDDPRVLNKISTFTNKALDTLNLTEGAFHLELIMSPKGLYFLEIGARIGGGEIPFVAKGIEGVDLYELWSAVIQGKEYSPVENQTTGFLMVPCPWDGGYKVQTSENISHKNLVSQTIINKIADCDFSYENIPGRFHFRGKNAAVIESAIEKVALQFNLQIKPMKRMHT